MRVNGLKELMREMAEEYRSGRTALGTRGTGEIARQMARGV